jgi:hypothetical protein
LGTKHLPKKLIFGINSSYYPIKDRKMTAKFFVLALFASLSLVSQTGAKNFKTVKYEEKIFDNPDYKLYIVGSFSRSEILKIKIRVFNKSKNLIYIKPEEIQFLVNGEKIKGKGRLIVVQPNGDEARLIDVEGAMDMRCDKFEVILSIIEPGNTVAIMASNKKNFNSFPKNEIFALEKGEPQTITIEFRKLNTAGDLTDGYKVEWNDVFKIGKLEAYEINRATINMDLAKSDK